MPDEMDLVPFGPGTLTTLDPETIDYAAIPWAQARHLFAFTAEFATRLAHQFLASGRYRTEAGFENAEAFIEVTLHIGESAFHKRLRRYGLKPPIRVSGPANLRQDSKDAEQASFLPPAAPPIETSARLESSDPEGDQRGLSTRRNGDRSESSSDPLESSSRPSGSTSIVDTLQPGDRTSARNQAEKRGPLLESLHPGCSDCLAIRSAYEATLEAHAYVAHGGPRPAGLDHPAPPPPPPPRAPAPAGRLPDLPTFGSLRPSGALTKADQVRSNRRPAR